MIVKQINITQFRQKIVLEILTVYFRFWQFPTNCTQTLENCVAAEWLTFHLFPDELETLRVFHPSVDGKICLIFRCISFKSFNTLFIFC